MPESRSGTLYLVATPIGNLEDITLRALRVLREVGLVAAEDTRHTAKLLNHYGIRTTMLSVHDHNEAARIPGLLDRLTGGESVALVSDAGMPSVSDPGFRIARAVIAAGCRVEVVPGPSAVVTALAASGLPTDAFTFLGFAPPRAAARRAWFEGLRADTRTLVYFEAPHRVRESLSDALGVLGDRQVAVARELTKLHEELARGSLSEVLATLTPPRGEYTIVLAGAEMGGDGADTMQVTDEQVVTAFDRALESGAGRREAITRAAAELGIRPRAAYAAVERVRHS